MTRAPLANPRLLLPGSWARRPAAEVSLGWMAGAAAGPAAETQDVRRTGGMTMDRALRLWFLALYTFGLVGFLSNVWRIRRGRPAFEQQIGPLPEIGAVVAWFVPPLILLSGIGKMAIEQRSFACSESG
jgi:hypothetical protein